ncbi:darcynin family protein [Soonwooa sp.]|uniref:darcynin family protein n=1 Tax=Soonwooa sp. TaxID=1938592 RepID=UPI0026133FA1|nr:darcynin family protein [Soonwooa sp.]
MMSAQKSIPASNKPPYTILVLMNTTPDWLSLSRDERSQFFTKTIQPIFIEKSKSVSVKLYDSEYFHAQISDFMILETQDLDEYKFIIEKLRDTKVYGVPYFQIKDIIIGQQDLFESFNEEFKTKKVSK